MHDADGARRAAAILAQAGFLVSLCSEPQPRDAVLVAEASQEMHDRQDLLVAFRAARAAHPVGAFQVPPIDIIAESGTSTELAHEPFEQSGELFVLFSVCPRNSAVFCNHKVAAHIYVLHDVLPEHCLVVVHDGDASNACLQEVEQVLGLENLIRRDDNRRFDSSFLE